MQPKRLNLENFPDSEYAGELRNTRTRLKFPPRLEDEYLDEHLRRVGPRVRIWTVLALLIGLGFTLAQWIADGAWTASLLVHTVVIVPACIVLAWLAWAPGAMRMYLCAAKYLAPLHGAAVAAVVPGTVSGGYPEVLSMLSLLLVSTFFFIGLRYREALIAGAVTLLSYASVAMLIGMATPLYVRSTLFLAIAGIFGALIGREVEYSYRRRFLGQSLMAELVDRDGLTGLSNRRAFDSHLARVWQQSLRGGSTLAVILIDIDHFKPYNDRYGHQAGDDAVRQVAAVIKDFARRPLDIAARYGGEEFTIVVYDLDADAVDDIAARLCASVEALQIEHAGSSGSRYLTVSAGVGVAQPQIGRTPDGLVQLADEALYEAKSAGRNGYVVHGQAEYDTLVTGSYNSPVAARAAAGG